jgi:hypothetical protein
LKGQYSFRERVPLQWLGLIHLRKMATKASAKKAAPQVAKKAAGATKAKPKSK